MAPTITPCPICREICDTVGPAGVLVHVLREHAGSAFAERLRDEIIKQRAEARGA
jgi:hypothetical protein